MRDEGGGMIKPRLSIVAFALFLSCEMIEDWSRHEEFEKSLRCGMSAADVSRLAIQFGAEFKTPTLAGGPGIPDHYVQKRWRLISLYFEKGRLRRFRSSVSSPSNSEDDREAIEVDLCKSALIPPPSSL